MPFPQLLIRWIVMVVLAIVSGLWQGKTLSANLLGIALLSATAVTSIAALYPLTELPGLFGIAIAWLRHFLSFTIIIAVLTKYSVRRSCIMGVCFASILLLLNLLW